MVRSIQFLIILLTVESFSQYRTNVIFHDNLEPELKQKIEVNVSKLITEFNSACIQSSNPDLENESITQSAKNSILSLWKTAPFLCTETEIITRLIKRNDNSFEIRNLPFKLQLSEDSTAFEEAVLIVKDNGQIENLYFGLETHQYNKLLREGKSIEDFARRQVILDFVENFRTAYNRRDLNLLENVFSDNALIIVGKVIDAKPQKNNLLESNLETQKVELIKLSKKQYINQLRRVFQLNSYIKVAFDRIEIIQHRLHQDLYGVTLKQHWMSSNYSDKGYIFLLVDFRNNDAPLIHVRSWQPEEFTKEEDVISLGDFEIIR